MNKLTDRAYGAVRALSINGPRPREGTRRCSPTTTRWTPRLRFGERTCGGRSNSSSRRPVRRRAQGSRGRPASQRRPRRPRRGTHRAPAHRGGRAGGEHGGKRATTLSIDAEHHLILVLVVQPTSAYLALVALDGSEVARRSVSYTTQTRDRVLDETVAEVVAAYGARLLAVGVQVPGTTDGRTVLESVQLEWHEVPLAERFETIAGVPVLLVNDVDAEAIAEAGLDAAPSGYRLFIHSGGGIGAAVTLDGELAPGPRDRAGRSGMCRWCSARPRVRAAADAAAVWSRRPRWDRCWGGVLGRAGRAGRPRPRLPCGSDADRRRRAGPGPCHQAHRGAARSDRGRHRRSRDGARSSVPGACPRRERLSARGTADVPIRYADPRVAPSAGAAQAALTAVLGVRWSPEQLRAGGPAPEPAPDLCRRMFRLHDPGTFARPDPSGTLHARRGRAGVPDGNPGWTGSRVVYFTLPAVRPPTRRFSMSMNRMMTGRIATIETPNTYCQLVSY